MRPVTQKKCNAQSAAQNWCCPFMNTLSKILLGCIIISFGATIYTSFGTKPDITLWNWFGYNFGINATSYSLLKLVAIGLAVVFAVVVNKSDKKTA